MGVWVSLDPTIPSDVYLGAVLIIFGVMAFLVIPFLGVVRDRDSIALGYSPDAGEAGVVFAYKRLPAVLLGLAVFMAGIAFMTLLGGDDPAVSHRAAWITIFIPICFMGGALGMLFGSLSKVVILSPASITYSRGKESLVIPWGQVERMSASTNSDRIQGWLIDLTLREQAYGSDGRRPFFLLRPRVSRGRISIEAGQLKTDPALLYHALDFYLRCPDARTELSTSLGIKRLVEGGGS